MLLQLRTWPEIEHYLQRSRGIIVPVGSTEQHGPNGLIGTDALCAEAIAQGVGQQYDVLIAPTLALGVAQFNLAFPGTISIRASTLMVLVEDIVQSLIRHGFRRVYFLNGHGGNIAPLRAVFQDIYWPYSLSAKPTPIRCRLRSWWEYTATNALRQQLYGAKEGLHATPSEVAITQHVHRAPIGRGMMDDTALLDATFLRNHAGDNYYDADEHRTHFPDGRVGSDPALADPQSGKRLLDTAIEEAYADYCAFLAED